MDNKKRTVRIIFTSDIHGNYFPYDFRKDKWGKGSLQRVHGYVAQQCRKDAGSTILIDGGDMIQGEPTSYYFNFVSQSPRHKVADMCNFIGYDVGVIGNHDIETGHDVFDSFVSDCTFPILGANVISTDTGQPYFEPYTIFNRCGIRIAVIGFTTPAIPHWIPKKVWQGLKFEDIRESAAKWVKYVKEKHNPDFVIGLFHSGMDEGITTPEYKENATRDTAASVDGFDLILYGHDHTSNMEEVESPSGRSVLCVNPGSYAQSVAEIQIDFMLDDAGRAISHDTSCRLCYIGTLSNLHSQDFKQHFHKEFDDVRTYSSKKIATFDKKIDISEAYFGSSAYIDLIQELQLLISGADISFAAPLFFNAVIDAGDVRISDLFNIYRFEDRLYILQLYGREIQSYLEMSYDNWINQMNNPEDTLLQMYPMKSNPERMGFKNFLFNFDSAAGIIYDVDVRQPSGCKVHIKSMADGTRFDPDRMYTAAMTAYRANGGGELLTKGAGLSKQDIEDRTLKSTERDIRHYLMTYLQNRHTIHPQARNHWKFIPEEWIRQAREREMEILFGKNTSES